MQVAWLGTAVPQYNQCWVLPVLDAGNERSHERSTGVSHAPSAPHLWHAGSWLCDAQVCPQPPQVLDVSCCC